MRASRAPSVPDIFLSLFSTKLGLRRRGLSDRGTELIERIRRDELPCCGRTGAGSVPWCTVTHLWPVVIAEDTERGHR